ncbi:MAG: glutaminyl-peptide cyclotransferase [Sandaracinaceae bacterium]
MAKARKKKGKTSGKRRAERAPTPGESAVTADERDEPEARPASPKRKREGTVDAPSSRPAQPPGRPYWIGIVIALVLGAIAYQRFFADPPADADADHLSSTDVDGPTEPPAAEALRVNVLERFPHDPEAFTQGLLWHDDNLFESTGLRGESSLRHVDLESGRVLQIRENDPALFAEGLARVGSELFQLTWQAGEVHVWSVDNFDHRRMMRYEGEGWGLCYDGRHLVMSDGSDRLAFRDPVTFEIDHVVRVRDGDGPVRNLNELECVDGTVWSNVWQTNRIVRIDPVSGRVTGDVDARGLLTPAERRGADVLNGIAWVPERQHFLITGKRWPWMFEVTFEPAAE